MPGSKQSLRYFVHVTYVISFLAYDIHVELGSTVYVAEFTELLVMSVGQSTDHKTRYHMTVLANSDKSFIDRVCPG